MKSLEDPELSAQLKVLTVNFQRESDASTLSPEGHQGVRRTENGMKAPGQYLAR